MRYLVDEQLRRTIAARCAAFSPLALDPAGQLKRAAVAIAVAAADNGSEAAILLTRRAKGLRTHGGQWALPGGRCDEGETPVDAALRELSEELGLVLGQCDVLGLLDGYPTRSGYHITPIVLWAGTGTPLRLNPAEVEYVRRIPLADIVREDAVSFVSIPESDRPLVRLWMAGDHIHAPTAAILYQFAEVLAGRNTRVHGYEQPAFAWK